MEELILKALEQYGITGVLFGVVIVIVMKQHKACQDQLARSETEQRERFATYVAGHREMVNDYVELVRKNTEVIVGLTACIKSLKETIDRLVSQK